MGIGIIFPGQGSQYVGMGEKFYKDFNVAKKIFDESDNVLRFSLSSLIFQGPEEELKLTYNAQPAILTTSIAIYETINERLPNIAGFAGHSLGEYSAVVAAEGMRFNDAVLAVYHRGKFMQNAVPVGAGGMLAVMGGDREIVEKMCMDITGKTGKILEPANYNSPSQIVLAGHMEAINTAAEKYKGYGIKKAVILPVSAPFHCSLMKPAAEKMEQYLENVEISSPIKPVYCNVDAKKETGRENLKKNFVRQVSSPVLWEDLVKEMIADGIHTFVEVGPGSVLTGLMKKIDKSVRCVNISEPGDLQKLEDLNVQG